MNNVTVRLGNNGKQTLAGVGTLHVTEKVVWPQGAKRDPNKSFPFTLQLEGTGADGEFQAVIAGEGMTVTNGQTFELKDGESVTVYGLRRGSKPRWSKPTMAEQAGVSIMPMIPARSKRTRRPIWTS